jgi:hypothetical protein
MCLSILSVIMDCYVGNPLRGHGRISKGCVLPLLLLRVNTLTTFIATKMIATPVLLVLSRGNRLSIHVEDFGMQFWLEMDTNLWVKIGDLHVLSRLFHFYEIHFAFKLQNMLHRYYISILFGTLFCNILESQVFCSQSLYFLKVVIECFLFV